jgi:hypothetical protein
LYGLTSPSITPHFASSAQAQYDIRAVHSREYVVEYCGRDSVVCEKQKKHASICEKHARNSSSFECNISIYGAWTKYFDLRQWAPRMLVGVPFMTTALLSKKENLFIKKEFNC